MNGSVWKNTYVGYFDRTDPDGRVWQGIKDLDGVLDRLREIDGWKELPAIKNGRIVHVEGDLLTRAGPRLVDAVEILANQLHPAIPSATETPTK